MKVIILFLSLAFVNLRCTEEETVNNQTSYEGSVIGKIRSGGGGIAISMRNSTFSKHQWQGFPNVVEALNVPDSLKQSGKHLFFSARVATQEERVFIITADGDESVKPIIVVTKVSAKRI